MSPSNLRTVALGAALFCALSTPARAAPISLVFEGTLDLVLADEPGAALAGMPLTTAIRFSVGYADACTTPDCGILSRPGLPQSLVYFFLQESATLEVGRQVFPFPQVAVGVQNNLEISRFPSAGFSHLLGTVIPDDTLVDSWTISGSNPNQGQLPPNFTASVTFLSLAADLWDDAEFKLAPNATQVDAVVFNINQFGDGRDIYDGWGFARLVPELGTLPLLAMGSLGLSWRRGSRGR